MILDCFEKKDLFTNAEQTIIEYIKNKPYTLDEMTADDLGVVTDTSKSTVFRLLKKLKVKSFADFKARIKEEYKQKQKMEEFRLKEPFDHNSNMKDIMGKLPMLYDHAIVKTTGLIEPGTISKVVRHLREANGIDLYGSGITQTCATAAAFKFQTLGKHCDIFSNINEHYVVSTQIDKKVAILLSFTGGNAIMVRCAKELRKLNCYTVGIGGVVSTELKDNCDVFLEIYQQELVSSFEFLTPYISMTYILDVIFAGLMVKDFDRHFENSAKVCNLF